MINVKYALKYLKLVYYTVFTSGIVQHVSANIYLCIHIPSHMFYLKYIADYNTVSHPKDGKWVLVSTNLKSGTYQKCTVESHVASMYLEPYVLANCVCIFIILTKCTRMCYIGTCIRNYYICNDPDTVYFLEVTSNWLKLSPFQQIVKHFKWVTVN
jgi:hypothetical protein